MKNPIKTISVIILAKNEEERIRTAIQSVPFASEVIVIDNSSEDETVSVARKAGAKVIRLKGDDFSFLRMKGASYAHGDWLLYLDADEEVSPELASDIPGCILDTDVSAYAITRKNYYLGVAFPDKEKIVRLVRKKDLLSWDGNIHETARVKGSIGECRGDIIHKTHRDIASMVEKTNEWSKAEAALRFNAGHPLMVPWRFFRVMLTAFWDSYITKKGIFAGTAGIVEAFFQMFSMFITYAKLWEMQNAKEHPHET